ncbi:MAG: class I SAM-dependent methyltransferase [Alphaproteobacteria bacterium]|jgi:SAM-dependent methyltransferase|nr:class I SAM-dependent methyltransferase [Alphaproteobacteria bacterium]MDP6589202.1 class I SAM-dependent methyltransferase [Alphaproteobacteria bacterium]MDP6816689.1 class I SAM-dependent methyltransferase [Alphaproteobacteria bacterium]|tara:strand:- start:147 stop:917 length:771 start_codon:yes stop_codon:yes gene_type:complete
MSDRATNSDFLSARAAGNKRFAGADFDGWVGAILDQLSFASVLDICCGTGNQLALYGARPDVTDLVGVDISAASLAKAQARLDALDVSCDLVETAMETAFAHAAIVERKFDLVSCFYGLYYAEDAARIMAQMMARCAEGGALLIVGPHGSNNSALFELLRRHFEVPPAVLSSAADFMTETVLPVMARELRLETQTFVNPVRYPSPAALLDYWRNSTFFSAPHEAAVARDLAAHFERHGEFVLEKHVMAAIGRKVAA